MHMGSLAIIGSQAPANLHHVVLNNGAHDSVGGQPTAGLAVDLAGSRSRLRLPHGAGSPPRRRAAMALEAPARHGQARHSWKSASQSDADHERRTADVVADREQGCLDEGAEPWLRLSPGTSFSPVRILFGAGTA